VIHNAGITQHNDQSNRESRITTHKSRVASSPNG
jgi:hypothetical protein